MAGSENRVTIVIDGRNDAGGAFASATAEAKAFQKAAEDSMRSSIAASRVSQQAADAQSRAWLGVVKAFQAVRDGERLMAGVQSRMDAPGPGLLSRLLYGRSGDSGGFLSGLRGVMSTIGGMISGLGGGAISGGGALIGGTANIGGGAGGGVMAAIAGGALISAAVTGLLGAIPGILSAGAGVAAFGGLAFPTISKILGFPAQLSTLQQARLSAQQQLQLDRQAGASPFTLHRDQLAVQQAQGNIHALRAGLPPGGAAAVGGVAGLQGLFGQMATSFGPTVMPIFNNMVGIASNLLPKLAPLAKAVAPAIQTLLNQFGQFVTSPGFSAFIGQMSKLAGPWLVTLGQSFGQIAVAVGKFLMALANPNAMRAFRILMDAIAWALQALAWVIGKVTASIVQGLHQMAHIFDVVRHAIAAAAHSIANEFDRLRHFVAQLGHEFAHWFDRIRHDVATLAHTIASNFDHIRHDIASLGHDFAHAFDTVRHAVATLGHDIAHGFDKIRHDIAHAWDTIRHDVAHAWDQIRHDVAAGMAKVVTVVTTEGKKVLDWFQKLPGLIKGFLASLPGILFQIGYNIISRLAAGIRAAAGLVGSAISFVAGLFSRFLPHSPALEGPLSGEGDPLLAGMRISQRLATGIRGGVPAVSAAAGVMAGAAGISGGGAGGGVVIHIQPGGSGLDRLFIDWLKYSIRASGGDPRILTQKVRLA